jgi:hypothetical protein
MKYERLVCEPRSELNRTGCSQLIAARVAMRSSNRDSGKRLRTVPGNAGLIANDRLNFEPESKGSPAVPPGQRTVDVKSSQGYWALPCSGRAVQEGTGGS